jgi:SAM-dependent methyltransferase
MRQNHSRSVSAETYFIRSDYQARTTPAYFSDDAEQRVGLIWQPDVYAVAAGLAERYAAQRLVDIGCGDGQKLVQLHSRFDVCGIDFGANIEACRRRYSSGTWIEHDLDAESPLPIPDSGHARAVLICSDVIEHVVRPDRLLLNLRKALESACALVVSTPERDLSRGPADLGPPANPAHVREWTLEEFSAFLGWAGFTNGRVGLTRSNNQHRGRHTILAVLESIPTRGGTLRVEIGHKRLAMLRRRAVTGPSAAARALMQHCSNGARG